MGDSNFDLMLVEVTDSVVQVTDEWGRIGTQLKCKLLGVLCQ